jgi:hypothetical protein
MATFRDPSCCLQRPALVTFLCESFFDSQKRSSVVACFTRSLTPENDDPSAFAPSHRSTIEGIVGLAKRCLEIRSETVLDLFPIIESSAGSLSSQAAQFACETGLVDLIADVAAAFVSKSPYCISLLTTLSQQNQVIFDYLTSGNLPLYATLEQTTSNGEPGLPKAILEFAIIFKPTKGTPPIVRNSKAIELLLLCGRCSAESEVWVTSELARLVAFPANQRQLGNGRIPGIIIERVGEVQANDALRETYLTCLKAILPQMFTESAYMKSLSLVTSSSFAYPGKFVQLYLDLLLAERPDAPATYYHFDDRDNGIFIAPLQIGDSFSVFLSFRLDVQVPATTTPLIALNGAENIYLYFKENFLWVGKKDFERQFPLHFVGGRWYSLAVAVSPQGFSASVDGGASFSVPAQVHLGMEVSFCIASRSAEKSSKSLVVDVAWVMIFKSADLKAFKGKITPTTISPSMASSLVLPVSPTAARDRRTSTRGNIVWFQSTIHDFLLTSGGLATVLTIFGRLADHSLSQNVGQELLILGLRLLRTILRSSEDLEQAFFSMNGIPILSVYLCRANSAFFGHTLVQELLPLFESFTLPSLQVHMVEHIWLNFDLAFRFGTLREIFFSTTLLAHQINPATFGSRAAFDIVVYQAVQMDRSQNGDFLWGLIEKFIYGNVGPSGLTMLVYISLCQFSLDGAQRGLTLLKQCLDERPVSTEPELHFGLLELLRVPKLQTLALSILDKLSDASALASLLYRAPVILAWSDPPGLAPVLRQFLYGPRGWMYIPLFVTCALKLEASERSKLVMELVDKIIESPADFVSFTNGKYWYSWLLELLTSIKLDEERFAKTFARLLDQFLKDVPNGEVRSGGFCFLAADPSRRWLLQRIFQYLLRDAPVSSARFNAVFEPVFEYLFAQFANTDNLHILLDVGADGAWKDRAIAENLISGFDPQQRDFSSEWVQKVTYVVAHLWRAGRDDFAQKIVTLKADAEIIHSAFAMLSHVAEPKIVNGLEDYKPPFDDSDDSNALQFFMFENTLSERLQSLTRARADAVAVIARDDTIMREAVANETTATMKKIENWKELQRSKVQKQQEDRLRLFEAFASVEHRVEGQ